MDREWNDNQPIYRQLRDRVVAMILDEVLKEAIRCPRCAMSRPMPPSRRHSYVRRRGFGARGTSRFCRRMAPCNSGLSGEAWDEARISPCAHDHI